MATAQDLPEFEAMRRRTQQRFQAQSQQQQDALKRRAAALGNLNSGAYIKQAQNAAEANNQQQEEAMLAIDTAQTAEGRRLKEIEEGRKFQTSEREAGQGFAAEQALRQREFATGERVAGQGFASEQAKVLRDFQLGENDKSRSLQSQGLSQQAAQHADQAALAKEQLALDKEISAYNMKQDEPGKPLIGGVVGQTASKLSPYGAMNAMFLPATAIDLVSKYWPF